MTTITEEFPAVDPYDVDMTGEPDSSFGNSPEAPASPESDKAWRLPERDGPRLTAAQMAEKTDEFPYGRRADGTAKRKPGPSKGTRAGNAIPRPTKTTRAKPGPKQTHGTDYRAGIMGMIQIPAATLGMLGQRDEAFALDGAALSMHSPAIAEALNELAQDNIAVAAALDRILAVGPYGAILGALMPLAFQIAANHRVIPDAMAMGAGALPRDQFRDMLIAQSQRG